MMHNWPVNELCRLDFRGMYGLSDHLS